MIGAKVFIFIEPIVGISSKLRYITDINEEKTLCDQEEFFFALKREHRFTVDKVKDIQIKLNSGMSMILDLEKKIDYRYDEGDKILIKKEIIRNAPKGVGDRWRELENISKSVEKLIHGKYFTQ